MKCATQSQKIALVFWRGELLKMLPHRAGVGDCSIVDKKVFKKYLKRKLDEDLSNSIKCF